MSALVPWLKNKRVVVLLGAGGVGKTTSSIVMSLLGARLGRRVALLSIDPAKRLASALGIPLGSQLRKLTIPPEFGVTGTLDAAMLDQKAMFDSMVRRYAVSDVAAEKILANKVYKSISTNLSGPLEYMALAKLTELAEDHRYDLIVLDTPPDTHALDFLARPNVLSGFVENKVMTWLVRPFLLAGRLGLGRVLNAGEKLMGGVAKVTGVAALRLFAEWLVLMQEVIEGFNEAGAKTKALLGRRDTGFVVVTVPTRAAARSAMNIAVELKRLGYGAEMLLFNRCLPEAVVAGLDAMAPGEAATTLATRRDGERQVIAGLDVALALQALRLEDQEQDLGSLQDLMALAKELS